MNVAGSPGRPDERPVSIITGGLDTPIPEAPPTLRDTPTWVRLWTVGRGWLSNDAHYDLMRILCEAIEDRNDLRKLMGRRSRITKGSMGQDRVHPALKELDVMDVKIARILETAGFAPERHKRVVTAHKGRLDAIRERKAAQT